MTYAAPRQRTSSGLEPGQFRLRLDDREHALLGYVISRCLEDPQFFAHDRRLVGYLSRAIARGPQLTLEFAHRELMHHTLDLCLTDPDFFGAQDNPNRQARTYFLHVVRRMKAKLPPRGAGSYLDELIKA